MIKTKETHGNIVAAPPTKVKLPWVVKVDDAMSNCIILVDDILACSTSRPPNI
jgi:hypothetical protein